MSPNKPSRNTSKTNSVRSHYTVQKINDHHGDLLNNNKQEKVLRIYQQNIRGAKLYNSWEKWKEGIKWINNNKIDVAFLVKTNTVWTTRNTTEAINKAKAVSKGVIFEGSSSDETTGKDYQPGGTACIIFNNTTGYKKEIIKDSKGLGRWCGFKLKGINKKTIVILSAYKPTVSKEISHNTC
jgi:hypothetical protein